MAEIVNTPVTGLSSIDLERILAALSARGTLGQPTARRILRQLQLPSLQRALNIKRGTETEKLLRDRNIQQSRVLAARLAQIRLQKRRERLANKNLLLGASVFPRDLFGNQRASFAFSTPTGKQTFSVGDLRSSNLSKLLRDTVIPTDFKTAGFGFGNNLFRQSGIQNLRSKIKTTPARQIGRSIASTKSFIGRK